MVLKIKVKDKVYEVGKDDVKKISIKDGIIQIDYNKEDWEVKLISIHSVGSVECSTGKRKTFAVMG